MSQLDKCKSCSNYIIKDEYSNGVFYGCKIGRALNIPCNMYVPKILTEKLNNIDGRILNDGEDKMKKDVNKWDNPELEVEK